MQEASTVIRFWGGAIERAAWDRLWDSVDGAIARRALGSRRARYRRRAEAEMAALARLGLEPAVLLELSWVVYDLRRRGVGFGPGDGPQTGSLILHLLGLTGVDPLDHDLPFLGFGHELESRRLHLRVPTRVEQAEVASALRNVGGVTRRLADPRALELVIASEPHLAFNRELERMARDVEGGRACDPATWAYPWDDPETLRLIARGETEGVLGFGEDPVREALRTAAPRSLEEAVHILAVARDGAPEGALAEYLAARSGQARPPLPHPRLEEVLRPTAHLYLFREQRVDALARLLECSWEHAIELLRNLERGRDEQNGTGDLMEQIGGRIAQTVSVPHARGVYLLRQIRDAGARVVDRASLLARATEAYRQAFYKVHYPAVFHAARMNIVLTRTTPESGLRFGHAGPVAPCPHRSELIALAQEAVRDGLTVLPPDINRSAWSFSAANSHTVLFGLGAIARTDRALADRVVRRRRNEAYASLMDFCLRVFGGELSAERVEPLIHAGAFDGLRRDRQALLDELHQATGQAARPGRAAQQVTAPSAQTPLTGPEAVCAEGLAFQRELDVLGCVPSRQYFPLDTPDPQRLRPVT